MRQKTGNSVGQPESLIAGSMPGKAEAPTRRGFLGQAGLLTMGTAIAAGTPAALAQTATGGSAPAPAPAPTSAPAAAPAAKAPQKLDMPGKDNGLTVLGDRPLVAETPESLLDDDTTPISKFFIRNNGQTSEAFKDGEGWKLVIDGEVEKPLEITLAELKKQFEPKTYRMVLECGGNGRSFFQPPARGNQWTNGGAGCAEWTGVPLADVLKLAELKPTARYTANYGADQHLSGDATKDALSRGVPIEKALERHSLLVWAMNGEPLPAIHGGPLRLIIPGAPGSVSHKWLRRIWIRDRLHDGQGMGGTSYAVPTKPIVPGGKFDEKDFRTLDEMPMRSIITAPANGTRVASGNHAVPLRGAAWAGQYDVARVDVSIDFGATWQATVLSKPLNRFDWTRWSAAIKLPSDGYFEIWVRATDSRGITQPHTAGNWNPQGYGANPINRIAILVV